MTRLHHPPRSATVRTRGRVSFSGSRSHADRAALTLRPTTYDPSQVVCRSASGGRS